MLPEDSTGVLKIQLNICSWPNLVVSNMSISKDYKARKLLIKASGSGWGIVLFWVSQLHFMPADHKRAQLINFKKSCLNIPLVHLLKSGTVLWREGIFQKPDSERLTKLSVSKGHLFWLYVALEPFNEGSFSDTRGSKNKNPVLWLSLSKDLLVSQGLIWYCAIVDDSVFFEGDNMIRRWLLIDRAAPHYQSWHSWSSWRQEKSKRKSFPLLRRTWVGVIGKIS